MTQHELAIQHETAFVRSFIVRERRGRYGSMLTSKKRRPQFLDRLNHKFMWDIDVKYVASNPKCSMPSANHLCWVIASQQMDDAQFLSYSDVHDFLSMSFFGVVVSIVPGKLALYKDEAPADSIWLERVRTVPFV